MKDIDFDELDRAVSSVLGQKAPTSQDEPVVATASVQAADTEEKPIETTTPLSIAEAPKETVETPIAKPAPVTPQVPLAVKRRGKFMDMVNTPAAMSGPKPASPRPFGSHEALDLKPVVKPEISDTPKAESSFVTSPVESTVEHKAEPIAAVDESQALIGAEPAPLDDGSHTLPAETPDEPEKPSTPNLDPLADFSAADTQVEPTQTSLHDAEDPKPAVKEKTGDHTDNLPADDALDASIPPAPQTTPFLADTKVEKRPLGGFAGAEAGSAPSTVPTDSDAQNAPVVPLPRELQPDVLKVESDQPELGVANASGAAPFAAAVEAAPEPKDDDRVEGHPLFDTSTYHEPIAAVPHRSMPTWLKWLLGLLLCLTVGAGVGYFLFVAGL